MNAESDGAVGADNDAPPPAAVEAAPATYTIKKQPLWTYFLTPAAVLVGALVIAGAIWWTSDDEGDEPAAVSHDTAAQGGASTVGPQSTAPAAANATLIDTVKGYARTVGMDEAKFTQCINDQGNVSIINKQLQAGRELGVTGTPTFFINNKKLVGAQPLAIMEEIIQAELKGSPATLDGYSAAVKALAATNPPNFEIMASRPDIAGAPIEGSANAKVIVAEFSDFQCPFCRTWTESSLRSLRTKLGNDVALAFLHFPIVQIHANAGNASLVSVCADQQGKFWQMHDLLFARQSEWANLK